MEKMAIYGRYPCWRGVIYHSPMIQMYFVYLLRCKDNSLYCGQTNDVEKRVKEHNSSKTKSAKYTKSRRPVELVYVESVKTLSAALKRECEIKKLTKPQKEFLVQCLKKRNRWKKLKRLYPPNARRTEPIMFVIAVVQKYLFIDTWWIPATRLITLLP